MAEREQVRCKNPLCNAEFEPNWNTRKYCSDACAEADRKRRRHEMAEVVRRSRCRES